MLTFVISITLKKRKERRRRKPAHELWVQAGLVWATLRNVEEHRDQFIYMLVGIHLISCFLFFWIDIMFLFSTEQTFFFLYCNYDTTVVLQHQGSTWLSYTVVTGKTAPSLFALPGLFCWCVPQAANSSCELLLHTALSGLRCVQWLAKVFKPLELFHILSLYRPQA